MISLSNNKQFRYMMRKNIPIWKPEETIAQVRDFCITNKIDEVIFKVDTEDFFHGLMTPELLETYYPWLEKARDALLNEGVTFSINPWVTIGHNDRGRDMRGKVEDMKFLVNWTGEENECCGCPESKGWRKLTSDVYKMYASLSPSVLWVEDDLRLFNHPPTTWGCFCEDHLSRFSKIVGENVDREKIVAAILQEGEPHPWRKIWFNMLGDSMIEVAQMFEECVHEINPNIKIGLMYSGVKEHSIDGIKWDSYIEAFSKGGPIVARPSLGEYSDQMLNEYIEFFNAHRANVAVMPKSVIVAPELENFTFTRFNKSNRITRMQLFLCALYGYKNVTMNLFDHVGTDINQEPEMAKLLKESKPILSRIMRQENECAGDFGIANAHVYDAAQYKVLESDADYSDLLTGTSVWMDIFQAMGVATACTKKIEASEERAIAFTDQAFRGMSDDEIKAILSKRLIIDGSAAYTLSDMGYSDYIGLKATAAISSVDGLGEERFCEKFESGDSSNISIVKSKKINPLLIFEGTKVLSSICTFDDTIIGPGMTLFENDLGGTVIVCCQDLSKGIDYPFIDKSRADFMGDIALFLMDGKNFLRITNAPYIYSVYRNYTSYRYLALMNISVDECEEIIIELSVPTGCTLKNVSTTDSEGNWKPCHIEILERKVYNDITDLILVRKSETLKAMDVCGIKFEL